MLLHVKREQSDDDEVLARYDDKCCGDQQGTVPDTATGMFQKQSVLLNPFDVIIT